MTNTSKESKSTLLQQLHYCGFHSVDEGEIFSPLTAAASFIKQESLRPSFLLEKDAEDDFSGM